jgi:Zn-finger nucleic acid-binding protein
MLFRVDGPYRSGAPSPLPPARCFFCGGEVVATEGGGFSGGEGVATAGGFQCTRCLLPAARQEPIAGTPICPRCSTPFEKRPLAPRVANEATVHVCTACEGCFVRGPDWDALVGSALAAEIGAAQGGKAPPTPAATFKAVRCPACAREMERVTFGARSSVVIDVCPPHGAWFDAGELAQALAYHEQGPPPEAQGIDRWLANEAHLHALSAPVVERAAARVEAEELRRRAYGRRGGGWLEALFLPRRPFD